MQGRGAGGQRTRRWQQGYQGSCLRWATSSTGKYRLLRVIGEGGVGVVFEAEHTTLRQHVAIKMLLPDLRRCPSLQTL